MNRLQPAARRLSLIVRKASRRIGALLPDLHVYAGVALLAYAGAQAPSPIGLIIAPAILGLGLIWIVRFGGEPTRQR